jgi:hypothetical protein
VKDAAPGKARTGRAKAAWIVIAFLSVACSASAQKAATSAKTNPQASASELRIVAADVQMLLIAPDGKKTGFDPKLKTKFRAIADSAYYEDALLAYDSGRVDPNTTQTIDVRNPKPGRYKLVVSSGTAADGQEYEVRLNLYSGDGDDARARISGTVNHSKATTFEIRVSNNPPGFKVVDRAKPQ